MPNGSSAGLGETASGGTGAAAQRLDGRSGFPFVVDPLAKRSLADLRSAARAGVLSGVDPDGAWTCASNGGLRADRRVRERMDWYGNQLGPMSADELALVLAAEAAEACGEAAGPQAAQIWRAYQEATLAAAGVISADRAAIEKVSQAAAAARRRCMGVEWAEAFFGDDERLLAAQLAKHVPAAPLPQPLPDADERTAAVDASWRSWQQRIAEARKEVDALRSDTTLSAETRASRLTALLERRFEPDERLRAAGLLRAGQGG